MNKKQIRLVDVPIGVSVKVVVGSNDKILSALMMPAPEIRFGETPTVFIHKLGGEPKQITLMASGDAPVVGKFIATVQTKNHAPIHLWEVA